MSLDITWIEKEKLAIGSLPDLNSLKQMGTQNIKVVINLCEEPYHKNYVSENFVDYLHIPITDMGLPSPKNIRTFIRHMNFYERCGLPVFMHCHAGLGRSGTMAALYLVWKGYGANFAISTTRALRPGAIETKQQEQLIKEAEKIIFAIHDEYDAAFFNVKKIVELLRKKCPWDKEQTHETLIESLLDETFEVVEAIREKNSHHLLEELGDLLLQPLIQAQVSEDEQQFSIYESIEHLIQKLIHRHPHVFANTSSLSADGVVNQWSTIKKTEQNNKQYSPVEAIMQISQEASEYGFDWENSSDILRKVEEEVKEVEEAIQSSNSRKVEQEIGDLLFAVINITRFLKIDPVKSLERGRRKFEQRFRYLQKLISKEGRDPKAMTAKELDDYWNRVKSTFSSKKDDESV